MRARQTDLVSNVHKIPELKFEEQSLSSYSGLIVFQQLFLVLGLRDRLRNCFRHLPGASGYGHWRIFMMLLVHLLLGFRRLRDRDYYFDDPMVLRMMGLRRLPDVATLSRRLKESDENSVHEVQGLNVELVTDRLEVERFSRITLDFDGSVNGTNRHAQGSAVGFNKKKKGQRSYYPLYCTVAQTGQFLDMYHRPGNVHDSNGAKDFIDDCVTKAQMANPQVIEARLDSAFFSDEIVQKLAGKAVEFTMSVPFRRFPELKAMMEQRRRWRKLGGAFSYWETHWRPDKWPTKFRFLFLRQKIQKQRKGPLQLDLFEPISYDYDYKVIITNKTSSAKKVLMFHNGRGSQEGIFAEGKTHAALDYIPSRRLYGNQLFNWAAILAHNLGRELQMRTKPKSRGTTEKRSPKWIFQSLGTIQKQIIQRAGKLTNPNRKLTLTLSANKKVKKEMLHYLHSLKLAA
jgi:hypothetical protein